MQYFWRSLLVLSFGLLLINACKTGGRFSLDQGHSGDDQSQNITTSQKLNILKQQCEVKEGKVWSEDTAICLSPQEYCLHKNDGSTWEKGRCLTPEYKCLANGGSWQNNLCRSAEEMCVAQSGHTWQEGKCLSSKEVCAAREHGYRYKWMGTSDVLGECKPKNFLDFCQDGSAVPRGAQYTVAILKIKADAQSCMEAEKYLKKTTQLDLVDHELRDRILIEDLSPLMGLPLKKLILTNNKVEDLSPLAELKELEYLDLQNNKVKKLKGLEALFNLHTLHLGYNEVSSLEELSQLHSLRMLSLFHNRINDLEPLTGLTALQQLYLKTNAILNVFPLRKLHKLKELNLDQNPILSPNIIKDEQNCPTGPDIAPLVNKFCLSLR